MGLYSYFNQRKQSILIAFIIVLFISGCNQEDPAYLQSINTWHQLRIDSLKGKTGFLNLAGLYWLEEGDNSFGSDTSNMIQFPSKSASYLGTLVKNNGSVYLTKSSEVKINGKTGVDSILVYNDTTDVSMQYNSLEWFIIKRGKDFGVRLRDYENPMLQEFDSIDYFPTDSKWKFDATWIKYDTPKSVDFQNMIGMTINYPIYGAFSFEIDGKEYSLEPVGEPEPDGYFIMFYDKTSGHSTYGSGRYLYVSVPDENNHSIVDFNKAFNPPCAFTEFATCLFPHKHNRLPISITAGEKFSGH